MFTTLLYKKSGMGIVLPIEWQPIYPTLKYYTNLNGRKKAMWSDVVFSYSTNKFILTNIPKDLNGMYKLMPLCNSQERITVSGLAPIVKKFQCI
jgi:hypothetical protein